MPNLRPHLLDFHENGAESHFSILNGLLPVLGGTRGVVAPYLRSRTLAFVCQLQVKPDMSGLKKADFDVPFLPKTPWLVWVGRPVPSRRRLPPTSPSLYESPS